MPPLARFGSGDLDLEQLSKVNIPITFTMTGCFLLRYESILASSEETTHGSRSSR